MFAAKSLTMRARLEGQFADQKLALVVMESMSNNMCRFAPLGRYRRSFSCLNLLPFRGV